MSFKDRLKAFLDADKDEVEEVVEVDLDDDDEDDDKAALKAEIETLKAAQSAADDEETVALKAELEALKGSPAATVEAAPPTKSTATRPVRAGASSKKVDVGSMTMEERAKYGTDIMAPADKAGKSLI